MKTYALFEIEPKDPNYSPTGIFRDDGTLADTNVVVAKEITYDDIGTFNGALTVKQHDLAKTHGPKFRVKFIGTAPAAL